MRLSSPVEVQLANECSTASALEKKSEEFNQFLRFFYKEKPEFL